ncbi:MAG TPA: peptide-binding protein, partial [Flavisolibacter sp.]|nr:peptide-binding protein [Flavisolibacter sp.]
GQSLRKDDMVTAGIFKTASGWQDAKYYALIDGVEPGTIIRIVNPNNNKAIYAKVLDKMTGIRQNQGYNVRISNAAATALEVTDAEKFIVRVNY